MYTRILRYCIKLIQDNRNGHCSGDDSKDDKGKGGGNGHCS